jgi:DNA-binding transcriptional LysR family regulator
VEITLNQLRVFCEVARQGQFTRAAEALYVSQPAVSRCVKDLERQVGAPLFEAIGRRVQLTEAGRLLHEHAARVLAELGDAGRALEELREGETGRLVIGASSTPGTYLLPPLLGRFQRDRPGVEIRMEIEATREVVRRVEGGALDLGIVGETQFPPALEVTGFREESLVLIAAPDHRLAAARWVRAGDLAEEPFVLREPGSSTREVSERCLAAAGVTPRIMMELGSTEAVKKTVAAGLGISLVSEHAVELECRAGVLVARAVPDLDTRRAIRVIRRRTLRMGRLLQRFLEALAGDACGSAR